MNLSDAFSGLNNYDEKSQPVCCEKRNKPPCFLNNGMFNHAIESKTTEHTGKVKSAISKSIAQQLY